MNFTHASFLLAHRDWRPAVSMASLTVFGHILNIANGQSTKQEQNYGAKRTFSESEASPLSNYLSTGMLLLQANTDYSEYLSFYYTLTVALDQTNKNLPNFLNFLNFCFKSKLEKLSKLIV